MIATFLGARQIEPLTDVTPEEELVIYRVAQEALTNVARHADATQVALKLHRSPEAVVLEVIDDGRGLPPGAEGSSQGIRGMRERAMLVGANLAIEGDAGDGTAIRLSIPSRHDAA